MEMVLRGLVIMLFLLSTAVLIYAYRHRPFTSHLFGIIVWCMHVVAFTFIAILRSLGIVSLSPEHMNLWSNTVRLHGGIVLFTVAIYYLSRRNAVK
jgi:hypothetical protein